MSKQPANPQAKSFVVSSHKSPLDCRNQFGCIFSIYPGDKTMDVHALNKAAWDHAVDEGTHPYTKVIAPEHIAAARQGIWSLSLSDCKPVPKDWFPPLKGLAVLCLASGGGQQAPIFAALGAEVTLLD